MHEARHIPQQHQQQQARRVEDDRLFAGYAAPAGAQDELFLAAGQPRAEARRVVERLEAGGRRELREHQALADHAFRRGGVTFTVYGDEKGVEKIFPFDLIPRIVAAADWARIDAGLVQRCRALDLFLADVYGPQRALADGIVPRELVLGSAGYRVPMQGVAPWGGVRIHVAGIDLVRGGDGRFLVLEDNIRTPSGVSYVLGNREVMRRLYPEALEEARVRPVAEYPIRLRDALVGLADGADGALVVLSPGAFNSAYFEHSFLAQRMGCELVQGPDLFVHQDRVYMRTTRGPRRVAVIYRRIDDEFLDPAAFRADSLIGVPGLFRAYAAGNVVLANAIGNGVADDKAIYPFVPALVKYYLGEDAIIGQVETFICDRPAELSHVLTRLETMVVKAVDASGGYGMLFGPRSTAAEREAFAAKLRANPRGYIAQPVVELSTCPTWTGEGIAPRRVDLRPYVVGGKDGFWVLPGGLSRVALVAGSYVVNSSQGGGSKDTWVLER